MVEMSWIEVDGAGWRWGHGLVIPIKKSMVTGITQKSHTALFPLWSLRKNDMSKDKKIYIKRKHKESIKRNFKYLNVEKKKKQIKFSL